MKILRKLFSSRDDKITTQLRIIEDLKRDIACKQLEEINSFRKLVAEDPESSVLRCIEEVCEELISLYCGSWQPRKDWELEQLKTATYKLFAVEANLQEAKTDIEDHTLTRQMIDAYQLYKENIVWSLIVDSHSRKCDCNYTTETAQARWLEFVKNTYCNTIDELWNINLACKDRLDSRLEELVRSGIKNNHKAHITTYKREAFSLFTDMADAIKYALLSRLFHSRTEDVINNAFVLSADRINEVRSILKELEIKKGRKMLEKVLRLANKNMFKQ